MFGCLARVLTSLLSHTKEWRPLLCLCLSEENGMDQENPTGEEELAVLSLHKTLHQCTGR